MVCSVTTAACFPALCAADSPVHADLLLCAKHALTSNATPFFIPTNLEQFWKPAYWLPTKGYPAIKKTWSRESWVTGLSLVQQYKAMNCQLEAWNDIKDLFWKPWHNGFQTKNPNNQPVQPTKQTKTNNLVTSLHLFAKTHLETNDASKSSLRLWPLKVPDHCVLYNLSLFI